MRSLQFAPELPSEILHKLFLDSDIPYLKAMRGVALYIYNYVVLNKEKLWGQIGTSLNFIKPYSEIEIMKQVSAIKKNTRMWISEEIHACKGKYAISEKLRKNFQLLLSSEKIKDIKTLQKINETKRFLSELDDKKKVKIASFSGIKTVEMFISLINHDYQVEIERSDFFKGKDNLSFMDTFPPM
jgi:hypothetical protein